MRNDLTIIGREMTVFILAALFLALMILPIYIDVAWMNDALHETSFTETTQEIMLAVIAALFFIAAQRPWQLDLVRPGGDGRLPGRRAADAEKTLHALARLLQHRSWPVMASGFLVVLVFSRLFGIHALWQHLMLGDYNRVVKNMAEEGTELLGYGLCWLASVRYLWQTRPAAAAVSVRATESAPARHATSPVTSH
ncbi:unnamed protein product [Peronospora farinosa]|uniref:Uncharacterized protein n=1 Tax=Peronospora farinosa TaxID=134698 RepID=A0ABN8CFZ1_9STRA|nr:unnamed protein product [Peronospora farinosa]